MRKSNEILSNTHQLLHEARVSREQNAQTNETLTEIKFVLAGMSEKLGTLNKKIDVLGNKIDGLGVKIDGLGDKIEHMERSLGEKLDNMTEQIQAQTKGIFMLLDHFRGPGGLATGEAA